MSKTAIVAGSTGLIGSFLLDELVGETWFTEVRALTRKAKVETRKKIDWIEVDFDKSADLSAATIGADVVFCALGTTIKKAGSQEAFRKVDYQYVVDLAKAAKANGVHKFLVVSAIGSDADSRIFYSRVKGEMEEAIGNVGFEFTGIFQPSMLQGPREEKRLGEKIGIKLGSIVAPLMIGGLKKYRPIHVRDVAKSMVREAKRGTHGVQVLDYSAMMVA